MIEWERATQLIEWERATGFIQASLIRPVSLGQSSGLFQMPKTASMAILIDAHTTLLR